MLKEITTKMVEQTTVKYIAKDGSEFTGDNAEQRCIQHEKNISRDEIRKRYEKLCPKLVEPPCLEWVNCYAHLSLIRLETERDFKETLMDYAEANYDDISLKELEDIKYPCEVIIFEDDYCIQFYGTKEEYIEELKKTLERVKGEI